VQAWLKTHGVEARPFAYRTRADTLDRHAERLADFVQDWLGDEELPRLGILTHSMGGLVARAYLAHERGRQAERVRLVQIAPPNRGSQLAEAQRGRKAFDLVYGKAGEELQPARAEALGPVPRHVSALVLGAGRSGEGGYNPRIEGDDDGVVAMSETYLDGAEHERVEGVHSLLQWRPDVLERALAFLLASP
jgi:pimeloyl-ACP methyl ester carboxylesterase